MPNLYQKYRPLIFDDVQGHSVICKEFKKRSIEDDFPQSIYLTGYTGVGKTTLQRIVARCILCKNKDDQGNPCNKCEICQTVIHEQPSRFYYEYDCTHINIEDVRIIKEKVDTKVLAQTNRKVFVFDELQQLYGNAKARKGFLKILEKPSSNTFFILGSMDDSKVDNALKDRATTYKLRDIPFKDVAFYLKAVCEKEGIDIINSAEKIETIMTIAQSCLGSLRNAIATLERCIYSELWTTEALKKELAILSKQSMKNYVNALLTGDVEQFHEMLQDIDNKFIEELRLYLNLLFKKKIGLKLNRWSLSRINGIKEVDVQVIQNSLDKLFSLLHYPYVSQTLFEFVVINILADNKEYHRKKNGN